MNKICIKNFIILTHQQFYWTLSSIHYFLESLCGAKFQRISDYIFLKVIEWKYFINCIIFHQFHQLHGIKSSGKFLSPKFICLSNRKNVQFWNRFLHFTFLDFTNYIFQKSKINRHTKSSFGDFQLSSERFSDAYIFLILPLPPSNGNIYCLTCIDWYSN